MSILNLDTISKFSTTITNLLRRFQFKNQINKGNFFNRSCRKKTSKSRHSLTFLRINKNLVPENKEVMENFP